MCPWQPWGRCSATHLSWGAVPRGGHCPGLAVGLSLGTISTCDTQYTNTELCLHSLFLSFTTAVSCQLLLCIDLSVYIGVQSDWTLQAACAAERGRRGLPADGCCAVWSHTCHGPFSILPWGLGSIGCPWTSTALCDGSSWVGWEWHGSWVTGEAEAPPKEAFGADLAAAKGSGKWG